MRISSNGVAFIKRWEGLRARAYRDVAGVWTIGYGHTKGFTDGRFNAASEISEMHATALLKEDLRIHEARVNGLVRTSITQSAFDALVSFDFNTGGLGRSTALKRLNEGDVQAAADALLLWRKARVNGRLVDIEGLRRRRAAEAALMLQPA